MYLFWWATGSILAALWCWRLLDAILGLRNIVDLTSPEWDSTPTSRVTVVVPAKDEAESVEPCLRSLLSSDYDNYEIIAVDDRSDDTTGEIMDRLAIEHPQPSSNRGSHECREFNPDYHQRQPQWLKPWSIRTIQ